VSEAESSFWKRESLAACCECAICAVLSACPSSWCLAASGCGCASAGMPDNTACVAEKAAIAAHQARGLRPYFANGRRSAREANGHAHGCVPVAVDRACGDRVRGSFDMVGSSLHSEAGSGMVCRPP
jgi:hypothetical protein